MFERPISMNESIKVSKNEISVYFTAIEVWIFIFSITTQINKIYGDETSCQGAHGFWYVQSIPFGCVCWTTNNPLQVQNGPIPSQNKSYTASQFESLVHSDFASS